MSFSCNEVMGTQDIRKLRRRMPLKFFMKVTGLLYEEAPLGVDAGGPCTCRILESDWEKMTGHSPWRPRYAGVDQPVKSL